MEPEGSLLHSQEPATCPYPEPYQSSPCPPIPLPKDPFYFGVTNGEICRCLFKRNYEQITKPSILSVDFLAEVSTFYTQLKITGNCPSSNPTNVNSA
jgi:hypothetical protein